MAVPRRVAIGRVHTSPAGPARHRRRRRHERLHRRGVPPAGRARRRGRALHPGHRSRPAAGRRAGARRDRPARHRRPVRGPGQGGPAGPAVRLHLGGAARRGRPRARLLRPGALPLLAVRPGRLAGRASAGACRWCTPRTPWPRSRTLTLADGDRPSRWPGRSARSRSSPRPTGWSPTPTDEARDLIELYDADPEQVGRRAARRRPRPLLRRAPRGARRARAARPAGRRVRRCCSSAGSSRSRRPTCCSAPPPRMLERDPRLRERLVVAVVGGPTRQRPGPARRR